MAAYSCAEQRSEAMARLAGELTVLAQERFDAHQRGCAACRSFAETLSLALAAARAEPGSLSAADKDREYASLIARLGSEARPEQAAPATGRRRRWIWAAAAVALFGASVAAALFARSGRGEAEAPAAELVAVSPRPGLDVRAVIGTEWNLDEARGETTLVLRRGAVYVRLAPLAPGRSLHVRAPGLRVRVTGTIFTVRSEPGRPAEIAVLWGAVAIEREGGDSTMLVAGEASRGSGPRGAADRRDYDPVRDWLAEAGADRAATRAHAVTGGGAASASAVEPPAAAPIEASLGAPAPPPPPPPPHPPAPAPARRPPQASSRVAPAGADGDAERPGPHPTYTDAERALATEGPAAAAALLERLIAERPDGFDADTARLELGTLYASRLGRPDDARRHLRAFLRRHTAGAGVATATALLCRLDPGDPICARR